MEVVSVFTADIWSSVITVSRCRSAAHTEFLVAVHASSPVVVLISLLLAAVVLLASLAATLARIATSGEGPDRSDLKNFGHPLSRSSLRLLLPLLSQIQIGV